MICIVPQEKDFTGKPVFVTVQYRTQGKKKLAWAQRSTQNTLHQKMGDA